MDKKTPIPTKRCFGLFVGIVLMILIVSCSTVKPYQRAYVNDEAMQSGKRITEKFIGAVHNYREAAMGGGSGKASGGCGCN